MVLHLHILLNHYIWHPVLKDVVVFVLHVDMDFLVPATHCSTFGDRSFPVAAARAWNALPSSVRLPPSLNVFRRRLKTELFLQSYPP